VNQRLLWNLRVDFALAALVLMGWLLLELATIPGHKDKLIRRLIDDLSHPDRTVRYGAASALGSAGPDAVRAAATLVALLRKWGHILKV